MPILPILPGPIQTGPIQAVAPTSPAAPADATADPNGAGTFLDQLAAAFASLTPSQAGQPEVGVPLNQAPDEGDTDTQASEQSDQTDQTMADLAASFGLVPMPQLMPLAVTNLTLEPPAGDHADAGVTLSGAQPSAPLLGQAATRVADRSSTSDAAPTDEPPAQAASPLADASTGPEPVAPSNAGQPAVNGAPAPVLPQLDSSLSAPTPSLANPIAEAAAAQSVHETDKQPATDTIRAEAVQAPNTRPARVRGALDEPTRQPETLATPADAANSQVVQQPAAGSETHAGEDRHGHEHESAPEPTSPDQSVQPAAMAAVAGPAATNAPSATEAAHHPREVVTQIAQQAELYRLPGGRGVRIQLHPDGLGGVEVTLRYGASGGLELHVNVEHAATGSLVEAGWSDLRDALSQQGISPDRLVMSVSGPNGASLSSDSGSFGSSASGGFGSDAAAMGFGQSQSQDQQDRQPAGSARARWAPSMDGPPREETATPTSSSRIDLRV